MEHGVLPGHLRVWRAVLVHAIDEQARRFYGHFHFDPPPVDPFQLMLLMKDIRKALG
jgi:hypothetical protein